MKILMKAIFASVILLSLITGCTGKKAVRRDEAEILHQNQDILTQVIIYDVFSPPVASRIYAYSSLASYEAVRFAREGSPSISGKTERFRENAAAGAGQRIQLYAGCDQGILYGGKNGESVFGRFAECL
jgi:hypothetical protein